MLRLLPFFTRMLSSTVFFYVIEDCTLLKGFCGLRACLDVRL